MIRRPLSSVLLIVMALTAVTAFLLVSGCDEEDLAIRGSTTSNTPQANESAVIPLPARGKPRLAAPPKNAVFGMIYINIANNREYIYDGAEWVPHDQTVDDYYKAKTSLKAARVLDLTVILPTGSVPTPTGAHGLTDIAGGPTKHGGYDCKVCHVVGGVFSFNPNGPAVAAGQPLPYFDNNAKTCSNVSCHGMYAGIFSYYYPGGDGEPELRTVNYAGSGGSTPSWFATGLGCTACHGNPPRNGTWHSGYHAGGPTSAANQCQFCHPDASSPSNGIGDTITNASLHGNGTVNVQATFRSSCFGCH